MPRLLMVTPGLPSRVRAAVVTRQQQYAGLAPGENTPAGQDHDQQARERSGDEVKGEREVWRIEGRSQVCGPQRHHREEKNGDWQP